MNFDDYEALWRTQNSPALPPSADSAGRDTICDRIREEAHRFDRTILWRDAREVLASFAAAAWFAFSAWRDTGADQIAWGDWIAVALTLGVAIVLLVDRRNMPPPPSPDQPMISQIDRSLAALRHQARVLNQVPWTYALPLCLAIGASASDPLLRERGLAGLWSASGAGIAFVCALIGGFVVWLNRLAARRVLQPKIDELRQLRRELAGEDA